MLDLIFSSICSECVGSFVVKISIKSGIIISIPASVVDVGSDFWI
jgi:hypothetical protein